jgi:hypothetical protein
MMTDRLKNPRRRWLASSLVGGVIYMWLAMEVVADAGFIAIPFQLIMGAVFSIVFVGVALFLGFLLEISPVARFWYSLPIASIVMLVSAAFLLAYGRDLGLAITIANPDSHVTYKVLHPAAAYGSMFAAVFATLHFSRNRGSSTRNQNA